MKKEKIRVLMLSAELTPIAKVGGLGDVVGALPKALGKLGVDMRICLPFYGSIDTKKYPARKIASAKLTIEKKQETVSVWQCALPDTKIPIYLIKHRLFNAPDIYMGLGAMKNNKYIDHAGDMERFMFFSKACLSAIRSTGFVPDIIHSNDWHTALVTSLIKAPEYADYFKDTKTVYTIHNLANQGITKIDITGYLSADSPLLAEDRKDGDFNLMVQGILGSDAVTTVSPTYAKEILTAKYGAGLSLVLKKRKDDLHGILNGIDTDFFNPATDRFVAERFSAKNLGGKAADKLALQKKLGLEMSAETPLIGFVSRFVWQKGSDLVTSRFTNLKCQFVFLGTGDKKFESRLSDLAKKNPSRFSALITFDEALAHEIYAASDMFLVPSRFEPCGLTQMIAMRYGSVPIVRATGGLADTVDDTVGFTFKDFNSSALYETIRQAIGKYGTAGWSKLRANGMKKDFTWDKSAKEYLRIYKKLIR